MHQLILVALLLGGVAAAQTVPVARNLQANAQQARQQQQVLVLMVSAVSCPYCHLLKREIIGPLLASGDFADTILFRELLLDEPSLVVDFSGRETSADTIAEHYQEWITPTLLFPGPDGEELAERIRGINNVDFYGFYLEQAIRKAHRQLAF